jgi:hypothetical protein
LSPTAGASAIAAPITDSSSASPLASHARPRASSRGIWAQGGVSGDGRSLFAATGDTFRAPSRGDSEAVLRLAPDLTPPHEAREFFAPSDWQELDRRDLDLAGTAATPLDVTRARSARKLILALGKTGEAYLLDRDDWGGVGGEIASAGFLSDGRLQRLGLVGKPKLEQLSSGLEIFCASRSTGRVGEQCCGNPGECAMMKIKRLAATALLSMGALSPVLADDQKPAPLPEAYAPPLNLLMVATQLGHFKLWYAGAVQNWALADYELAQIRGGIERARTLYPNNVKSNMGMMTPVTDELEKAIRAKDGVRFSKAYSKLTATCNSCHEASGFGFIKMRDPTLSPIETSPFSDESFSGH